MGLNMSEDNFLEDMEDNINKSKDLLEKLKAIKKMYPSLCMSKNRWGVVRYCASEINPETNEVEIYKSCGCCYDASVLVSPYKIIDGLKIYASPSGLPVGFGSDSGDIPFEGWKKELVDKNISEEVISKIENYFETSYVFTDEDEDDNIYNY